MVIVAGLGCRPNCEAAEIVTLVQRASRSAGTAASVLAVPEFRATLPAIIGAARQLRLRLVPVKEAALLAVQPLCPTRSERAAGTVGVASVAEGCALAVAGTGGRLMLVRIASGNATCALAEGESAGSGEAA